MLLSAMAYTNDQDQDQDQDQDKIEAAFGAAVNTLGILGFQLVAKNDISFSDFDRALQKLAKLKPLEKPQLLVACATCVVHDRIISPVEVELLRAFADALDCPMPPIIPKTEI